MIKKPSKPAPKLSPRLSESEWDVMKVVWDVAPATAGAIVDAVLTGPPSSSPSASGGDRSPKTIKTLLSRLVTKGAVNVDESKTPYLYTAAVGRDVLVKQASKSFLHRVFDGAAGAALVHLIHESKLTDRELAEVKAMLEKKRS